MERLYTAFKGIHNTPFQLVSQLGCDTVLLTNSFTGLEQDIHSISKDYSAVYMFGIDKHLKDKVRIETQANYNGELINTHFDIGIIESMLLKGNIPYEISVNPSKYLCNASFYFMLKRNPNTIFIHIPSSTGMSIELMNRLTTAFQK